MDTPMEDPLATGFTTQGTGVVLVRRSMSLSV
mgnify:CR=1 FL=1